MARILRSPKALRDLDEIWLYIAKDSPGAADRWLDILDDKARLLTEHPFLGRARPELLADLAPDLRSFAVQAYVLFDRPVEGGIELVRVLNAARDLGSALSGDD